MKSLGDENPSKTIAASVVMTATGAKLGTGDGEEGSRVGCGVGRSVGRAKCRDDGTCVGSGVGFEYPHEVPRLLPSSMSQ